jgi:hypothetical protein
MAWDERVGTTIWNLLTRMMTMISVILWMIMIIKEPARFRIAEWSQKSCACAPG